jgi:transcriptional regulator with XRE-family HTH domain
MQNRIKELRRGKGLSLNTLEEMTGISAQQINRLEKGERRLNEDNISKIADALGYHPQDLFARPAVRVPVVGEVGAGGEVYPIDDVPLLPRNVDPSEQDYVNCEWVESPPGVYPNGIVAVRVKGTSMLPFMPPGTVVYYAERFEGGAPDHCLSTLCVVQMRDGRTLLKMVRKAQVHGKFDLQSYNLETIPDAELAWCAPVIFIKPYLGNRI